MKQLNLLISLLSILVLKGIFVPNTVADGFIGAALVAYCGYLRYLEWKRAKEVTETFETKLKELETKLNSIETKLSFNNIGRKMGQPPGSL